MSVAGVILAAGASTRLGSPKQLAEVGGERLLERAVRIAQAAGLSPIIVVLGARALDVQAACRLTGVHVVINQEWTEGMASSVRLGVLAAGEAAEGLVLMTCDQPAANASHLHSLVERGGTDGVVGSHYAGRNGVPAYFPRSRFVELVDLRGDTGARAMLEEAPAVELPGGELDVDTPEALELARLRFGGSR